MKDTDHQQSNTPFGSRCHGSFEILDQLKILSFKSAIIDRFVILLTERSVSFKTEKCCLCLNLTQAGNGQALTKSVRKSLQNFSFVTFASYIIIIERFVRAL